MLANLKPRGATEQIDVKVLKKWIAHGEKNESRFVFVDKSGHAIEAIVDLRDRSYFDKAIKIDGCYHIGNYICETVKPSLLTVPSHTSMKLGRATTFEQIADEGFPKYYFNFVEYDQLLSRLNNHMLLTDILQLAATAASRIYINADIEETRVLTASFASRDNIAPVLKVQYGKSENIEIEKQKNRFTLDQLLSQNPN